MFPELYTGVLRELNPDLDPSVWRRGFEPRGWSDEDHFGYALVDQGRIVGLMGTLFSERSIEGRQVPICNLHSWFVLPAYRGTTSLLLLRPVLALRHHIITDFTSTPDVAVMLLRVGFQESSGGTLFLPALPLRPTWGAMPRSIALDDEGSLGLMSDADLRILRDHSGIGCTHTILRVGSSYCYVVSSRIEDGPWPHVHVHYVSAPSVFRRRIAAFRRHLLSDGARYLAVPARLLREGCGTAIAISARTAPALIRPVSGEGDPPLDTLYSEMALFKWPVAPVIPAWARGIKQRLRVGRR
jgi:hypothetical protein